MTIDQGLKDFSKNLSAIYEARESSAIAEWVYENVLGLKKWQIRNNQENIAKKDLYQFEKYLDELLTQKPVQYVLNEAWFYKRKFFVDESVLIPRPETEELVKHVITWLKSKGDCKQPAVLDVGTGSGCIATTLKLEFPAATISAIDVSENALKVAMKNSDMAGVKIEFMKINFLKEKERGELQSYDIIVSNPPYIPLEEKKGLSDNVALFEPPEALFTPNEDPHIFYKEIAFFSRTHLNEGGKVFVEIHEKYSSAIEEIFRAYDLTCQTFEDIFGKPRIIVAS